MYSNVNNRKTDPQLEELEINFTNKNVGMRLSANGSIQPRTALLTSLDYNLSTQISRTEDIHISKVWSPDGAVTDIRESGIHQAYQKIRPYNSEYNMHGIPINVYAQLVAGKLDLYSGNDDQTIPILSLGGKGVISVLSNLLPAETSRMCHLYFDGDTAAAAALQLKYLPLIHALFSEVNPIPVKAAMAEMGWCENYLRMPLTPMEDAHKAGLFELMHAEGLI